jgi:hypothetical protein
MPAVGALGEMEPQVLSARRVLRRVLGLAALASILSPPVGPIRNASAGTEQHCKAPSALVVHTAVVGTAAQGVAVFSARASYFATRGGRALPASRCHPQARRLPCWRPAHAWQQGHAQRNECALKSAVLHPSAQHEQRPVPTGLLPVDRPRCQRPSLQLQLHFPQCTSAPSVVCRVFLPPCATSPLASPR